MYIVSILVEISKRLLLFGVSPVKIFFIRYLSNRFPRKPIGKSVFFTHTTRRTLLVCPAYMKKYFCFFADVFGH